MNEITLNALINLFALFSAISKSKKEDAIRNFSLYLHQHFGIADKNDYLDLFEELLDIYGIEGEPAFPVDMIEEATKISTNIRSWLKKEEQAMVLMRFLELVKNGDQSKTKVLFDTLANVFEISNNEVDQFVAFIYYPSTHQINTPDFLLIDNNENPLLHKYRHIYEKNIEGELLFLRSPIIENYLFIFHGSDYLTIDGNPIITGRFYAFREGSIIRGPRISPVYYTDIAAGFIDLNLSPPFVFSAEEIEYHFKNSNNGLYPFSFSEKSGQLIAIMGGSGVGKSTLLNILNGNIPLQHGQISINQVELYQQKQPIEGVIGFVPQDDLLFEDLTVWENLYFSASLSFDRLSRPTIKEKVEKVLNELELTSLKDLKVGSPVNKMISGGQRKRLNIALELIREPAILFVDEPTSGLSSTDSEKVMLLLKQQARKGKLLLVNIHQPSSAVFKLFDKLWVMDAGGRVIYTGNPLDAIIYFKTEVNQVNAQTSECITCGNVNPEQVLEIIETKKIDNSGNFLPQRRFSPEFWYEKYRKNTKLKKENIRGFATGLPLTDSKKPGRIKQFWIFFERNWRIKITDRQYVIINLLEAPVLAVIVAYFTRFREADQYIFFENKSMISYLFMSVIVVLFMGTLLSAEEIIKDRKINLRESFLNLSRFSYINSKILFLILLSAFQSFSFVWFGNLILGIQDMTMAYWLILFSVSVFSNLLGLNISSAFNSVEAIYIIIPLLLIPQILLCGVIVKYDDLQSKNAVKDAVPLIGEIMASRWAFEALAVEQFKDNKYMSHFFELDKEMSQARYRSEILTTELIGQVDLVNGLTPILSGLYNPEIVEAHKLQIIRNEINKLDKENVLPEFKYTESLVPGKFNNKIAELTKIHLNNLKDFYNKRYLKVKSKKDQLINRLNKEKGDQFLYDQKMKYHNKSLEVLVTNSDAKQFYRVTSEGYMQKIAPIYKDPDFTNGRAHFLASQKNLFCNSVDTLAFNVGVIWLMSTFLYISLYYNWLRKLLDISPQFKLIKSFFKNERQEN